PSSWCGVCGHKPSFGVVPRRGHLPPPPGTLADTDLGVMGPIARTVDDLDIALDILSGPHGHDAVGWRLGRPAARATALRDLRLAAWLDDRAYPVDPEVRGVLGEAVAGLRAAGATVAERRPDVDLHDVVHTYQQLLYPILLGTMAQEGFAGLVALAGQLPPEDDSPLARSVRFATLRHRDWLFAHERRERIRPLLAAFFRSSDVLLMLVTVVPAIPHDVSEPFTDRVIRSNGGERPYTALFGWIALTPGDLLSAPSRPPWCPSGVHATACRSVFRSSGHTWRTARRWRPGAQSRRCWAASPRRPARTDRTTSASHRHRTSRRGELVPALSEGVQRGREFACGQVSFATARRGSSRARRGW